MAEAEPNTDTADVEEPADEEAAVSSETDDLISEADAAQPDAQHSWRMAPDLPAFDDDTCEQIDDLLAQISAQVATHGKRGNWLPAEDDLLLLLRQFNLPYTFIYTV
jgi:hypothetical protein